MKKSKLSAILSVLFLSSIFSVACAATFTKFSSKFVKISRIVINIKKQSHLNLKDKVLLQREKSSGGKMAFVNTKK